MPARAGGHKGCDVVRAVAPLNPPRPAPDLISRSVFFLFSKVIPLSGCANQIASFWIQITSSSSTSSSLRTRTSGKHFFFLNIFVSLPFSPASLHCVCWTDRLGRLACLYSPRTTSYPLRFDTGKNKRSGRPARMSNRLRSLRVLVPVGALSAAAYLAPARAQQQPEPDETTLSTRLATQLEGGCM